MPVLPPPGGRGRPVGLDLPGPGRDDLAVLSEEPGLHPLAVEDALRHGQRPELGRYPSHLFLTACAARRGPGAGELAASQLAASSPARR